MSFRDEDFFNQANNGARVSQQIEEVIALTMSINRILEDCSIQWKSTISKKQWEMTNCRIPSYFSWQNSVVARTYFESEDLDNAFKNLLKSRAMFANHLFHFMNLLNGQTPQLSGLEIKNQEEINSSGIFVIEDRINENIQRTFSELLKAKIYFDKTLTSLNSIVSEKGSSTMDSSNCICQICSNVLETTTDKAVVNIESGKRRSKRNKIKRLNTNNSSNNNNSNNNNNNNRKFINKGKNVKSTSKKIFSAGDQNQTEII